MRKARRLPCRFQPKRQWPSSRAKAFRLHALRATRLHCSSKTTARCTAKTAITAAAVIPGSGELKTASCACAGSAGNTKAAASWFAWRAKCSTFTRMPVRYTSFLTIRTKVAMYSVAACALNTWATGVFIL